MACQILFIRRAAWADHLAGQIPPIYGFVLEFCFPMSVAVHTFYLSIVDYFVSHNLETYQRVGPERRSEGYIDRISAPCH